MWVGEPETVTLLLAPDVSPDALAGELRRRAARSVNVEGFTVRVSPVMEAVLAGQRFDITPLAPARQAVGHAEPAEWRWQVTPTAGGTQFLFLTLNAVVVVGERELPRVVRTYEREIRVEVGFGSWAAAFAQRNWQFLTSALVLPLMAWWWKARRSRRKPAERGSRSLLRRRRGSAPPRE
jgi:hypothetical protein